MNTKLVALSILGEISSVAAAGVAMFWSAGRMDWEDLPEDATSQTPVSSGWSIRDHVAHFLDTQEMLDTRIELMLTQDNPELTALAVYELAADAERHPSSTRATLAAFRAKRAQCVARLETLPLKDLWRSGRHPEFGQLTILRQAAYLAFHEQTHLPEVEALRMQVA